MRWLLVCRSIHNIFPNYYKCRAYLLYFPCNSNFQSLFLCFAFVSIAYRFSMEFHLSPVLTLLALVVVASHAALSPEQYWNYALPKTPMPKAVKVILHPELEDKSTSVNVGGGGVNVNTGKGKPGGTSVNVGKGGVNVNTGKGKPNGGTNVNVGGKGGVSVSTGNKGKPVYVNVSPFIYRYAATETQVHDDPNVAIFFLEKDMHPRATMTLHFTENTETATFLPRQIAQKIPFSSDNLPEILNKFSVKPGSVEAEMMKNTIKECEQPQIQGEDKYCATSLESMIDFSTSKLGKNTLAISTDVEKQTPMQKYTIAAGVQKMAGDKSVVCHKQNYAYAVFYCHKSETTRAYMVPLEGADGTKAKAVAICHTDTSAWNPKHLAFQVLKVEPGSIPICHFLPQDHIVWVPK
ncbi:BURP domain protein RD22-like isoform X2 [Durio zibethinus]|uniref:BURP domain protein RD22-like isoform X2 n=1 Tax=Durio zibethinus TaxID=66656 RepID=A0A6P5ZQ94_DURZI|nr:BURP domain protein RD22-like isoform X2 [Durio zibethinus]